MPQITSSQISKGADLRNSLLSIAITAGVILAIEASRRFELNMPIPFLLLYSSVVAAAGLAGMVAGVVAGALASAYILYGTVVGFGPGSLTGGGFATLSGIFLHLGTGLFVGFVRDQRNRFQQKLLEDEAELQALLARFKGQFKALYQHAPAAITLQGLDGVFQSVNRKFSEWYDVSEQDVVGKTSYDLFPKGVAGFESSLDGTVSATRKAVARERETVFADGSRHAIILTKFPVFDSTEKLIGLGTMHVDITDRNETERALRESEEHLRGIMNHVVDGIVTINTKGEIESFNRAAELLFGYPAEQVRGRNVSMLMPEPDRSRHDGYITNYLETGKGRIIGIGPREVIAQRKDGSTFPMGLAVSVMEIAGEKKFIGVVRDLTERKEIEHKLSQSQKMEAIGQLTGGVAHDFNNLLTAIIGSLQLLEHNLGDDPKNKSLLETAFHAAWRGADLTKRLLVFSRRESLSPRIINLNEMIPASVRLLERTLGEHIEIETVLAGGLWPSMIDQSLLENALINLAVNARDAMPNGGKLTIETANTRLDEAYANTRDEVKPGQYVMVAVSDTGTGMSPDVMARAFDPFFTTKEVGQGTGLGLSMVFGFVKQSGGHVAIYSEEGNGTTVKMYFPRQKDTGRIGTQPERRENDAPSPSVMPRGDETILVVEDDPDVRAFVVSALEVIGYTVLEADDGPRALRLIEDKRPAIDLLLTDVVMPGGMSGRVVADKVSKFYPGLKVLFTSGYTENAIVHHGRLDDDVELLAKPYTTVTLAQKVRKILDG